MAAPTSSVTSKFPTEAAGLGLAEPADPLARPRSKPIAGFVSTAVLSSSDGLFGDNVEETRISDKPEAAAVAISDARPLYDRLKEMKDQRDAEWKEKNNPFAPPKGLDDEEIEFLRALEDQQKSVADGLKRQHDTDLAQFVMAKKDTLAQTKKVAAVALPTVEKKLAPVVVVKAKPKKAASKGSASTQPKKKQKTTKTTSTGLGLVANYSDGDSSSDSD